MTVFERLDPEVLAEITHLVAFVEDIDQQVVGTVRPATRNDPALEQDLPNSLTPTRPEASGPR